MNNIVLKGMGLLFGLLGLAIVGVTMMGFLANTNNNNVPNDAARSAVAFDYQNETWRVVEEGDWNIVPERIFSNETTWEADGIQYVEGSGRLENMEFTYMARWVGEEMTYLLVGDTVVLYNENELELVEANGDTL